MNKQELQAAALIQAKHNSSYQIRPPFKNKFRPAEAKAVIEKIIPDTVLQQ